VTRPKQQQQQQQQQQQHQQQPQQQLQQHHMTQAAAVANQSRTSASLSAMVNAANPSMASYLNGTASMLGLPSMPNAASAVPGMGHQYGMWNHPTVTSGGGVVPNTGATEQHNGNPTGVNPGLSTLDWDGMEDFEVDVDHST